MPIKYESQQRYGKTNPCATVSLTGDSSMVERRKMYHDCGTDSIYFCIHGADDASSILALPIYLAL